MAKRESTSAQSVRTPTADDDVITTHYPHVPGSLPSLLTSVEDHIRQLADMHAADSPDVIEQSNRLVRLIRATRDQHEAGELEQAAIQALLIGLQLQWLTLQAGESPRGVSDAANPRHDWSRVYERWLKVRSYFTSDHAADMQVAYEFNVAVDTVAHLRQQRQVNVER